MNNYIVYNIDEGDLENQKHEAYDDSVESSYTMERLIYTNKINQKKNI